MNHHLQLVPNIHTGEYNQRLDDWGRESSLDGFLVILVALNMIGHGLDAMVSMYSIW